MPLSQTPLPHHLYYNLHFRNEQGEATHNTHPTKGTKVVANVYLDMPIQISKQN